MTTAIRPSVDQPSRFLRFFKVGDIVGDGGRYWSCQEGGLLARQPASQSEAVRT